MLGRGRAGGGQRAGSPSSGTLDPQSCSSLGSIPCQLLLGGRGLRSAVSVLVLCPQELTQAGGAGEEQCSLLRPEHQGLTG